MNHPQHPPHEYRHATPSVDGKLFVWAFSATLGFACAEFAAGYLAESLALIGDSGHMLTDSLALAVAAAAARLSQRPPSPRHSFGLARLEVLAALVNAGFMAALILGIVFHAAQRLAEPRAVAGGIVTGVAVVGLALNVALAWLLSRGTHDINTRGALLHVMGDLLGSLAALAAGVVVQLTGWWRIDPILSLAICGLIGVATYRLAREAIHTLLEGVPPAMSLRDVGRRLAMVKGVCSVHDLHIWTIGSGRVALSAHVVVSSLSDWDDVLQCLLEVLRHDFRIDHATLQPEQQQPTIHPITDPAAPSTY